MARLERIRQIAFLAVFLLPGCLDVEHHVELRADGTGTQRVTLKMTHEAMERARVFGQVAVPGGIDPLAGLQRAKVDQEIASTGLSLDHYAQKDERTGRTIELTLGFQHLGQLRSSPVGAGRAEFQVVATDDASISELLWYPQGREAWQRGLEQANELAEQPEDRAARWFRAQQENLDGLDIRLSLRMPGEVIACTKWFLRDGEDKQLITARVRTTDIKDPQTLVRMLAPRVRVRFRDPGGMVRSAANAPLPQIRPAAAPPAGAPTAEEAEPETEGSTGTGSDPDPGR